MRTFHIEDFIMGAAGMLLALMFIAAVTPDDPSNYASATICAMQENGLTSDWHSVRYHVEEGAVFIDGVTWEPSPTGEYIQSANTHTVRCGSVGR